MFRPTLNYFEHLNCAVHSTNPPPRLHTDWETGRVRRWWTELQTLQLRPIRSLSRFKMPTRFARAHSALSRPRAHFNGVLLLRFFFFFFFWRGFPEEVGARGFPVSRIEINRAQGFNAGGFFRFSSSRITHFFPPVSPNWTSDHEKVRCVCGRCLCENPRGRIPLNGRDVRGLWERSWSGQAAEAPALTLFRGRKQCCSVGRRP